MSGPRYSIIPGDAPYDTRLTDFDVRILACVGCHTNKSGWCSINQAKLSKRLDCSRQGVNKSITKLVELGYLDRVNRQSKSFGDKRSNLCLYRVRMDRGEAPDVVTESDELDTEPDVNDAGGCQPRTTQGVNPGLQHNDLSFNDHAAPVPRIPPHTAVLPVPEPRKKSTRAPVKQSPSGASGAHATSAYATSGNDREEEADFSGTSVTGDELNYGLKPQFPPADGPDCPPSYDYGEWTLERKLAHRLRLEHNDPLKALSGCTFYGENHLADLKEISEIYGEQTVFAVISGIIGSGEIGGKFLRRGSIHTWHFFQPYIHSEYMRQVRMGEREPDARADELDRRLKRHWNEKDKAAAETRRRYREARVIAA